jgi:alkyl hydroperoxide reductase subunit AhpF
MDFVALLTDDDRTQLEGTFRLLKTPVTLAFFTQTLDCETCEIAKQILEEVQALSDLITLEEHNFLLEKDAAAGYGIDRVPSIAVVGEHDHGIRFYGAPHGYEFASLLEAILLVGGAEEVGLSDQSRALLTDVREPVDIQVFVTPT